MSIEPSGTVARLLLRRRQELGLSLRKVQERTAELGQLIPFTTVGKIEQGLAEPGLKRLHVLLKVYDLPPRLAHELVELEQFSGDTPEDVSPATLYEEGTKHWKAGNLRKGLACLLAVRAQSVGGGAARLERQKAILSFAVAAGSVGRNALSKHIVDELLLEPPEPEMLVPVLIQAAVCWHRLSSGNAALGFLSRAAEQVAPTDHRNRTWIHHCRATTLTAMGAFDAAETEFDKALAAYRKANDTYGEGRTVTSRNTLAAWNGSSNPVSAARRARASGRCGKNASTLPR